MNETLSIVVSSRNTNEEKEGFIQHLKETCGCDINLIFLINKEGVSLTKIYSDMLKEIKTSVVLFLHDDVEFLKSGWGKELIELFKNNEEYGIIGVAGSADFDERGAWWNYKNIFGQVAHSKENKIWLTSFSPLLENDLEEVAVIDGLFMGVHKNRITKDFDVELKGFNFYDIDFCLSNFIDGKTKIGVTTNIRILHNSVGELKEEWYFNRNIINEKYDKYFPITNKKTIK